MRVAAPIFTAFLFPVHAFVSSNRPGAKLIGGTALHGISYTGDYLSGMKSGLTDYTSPKSQETIQMSDYEAQYAAMTRGYQKVDAPSASEGYQIPPAASGVKNAGRQSTEVNSYQRTYDSAFKSADVTVNGDYQKAYETAYKKATTSAEANGSDQSAYGGTSRSADAAQTSGYPSAPKSAVSARTSGYQSAYESASTSADSARTSDYQSAYERAYSTATRSTPAKGSNQTDYSKVGSVSPVATPKTKATYAYAKSAWNFPISEESLVAMAKIFHSPEVRYGLGDGGRCLADGFEFCAAVVGPLGKDEYLEALTQINVEDSFTVSPTFYGYYADPFQPGRVWFFNRSTAKHVAPFFGVKPKGKILQLPPQLNFLDFNEYGEVKQYGFYTIDRRQGNTGGLGGLFGYMYGVGKPLPFPEGRPFRMSLQYRIFSLVASLISRLRRKDY